MTTFEQKLKTIRAEIDRMDDKLIALIAKRLETAKKIQKMKREEGKNMTDKTREAEIMRKIENRLKGDPDAAKIVALIYRECFEFIKNHRSEN